MNSLHSHAYTHLPFLPSNHCNRRRHDHHHSRCLLLLKSCYLISCASVRRHLRPCRRKRFHHHHLLHGNTTTPSISKSFDFTPHDQNRQLKLTIDLENLTSIGKSKLSPFISRFEDAYLDLQTLVTLDEERRLVVSCKRSTVEFVGGLVVLSCLVVFSVRVLVKLVSGIGLGLGFGFGRRKGSDVVIVRRDRSLGGKEVVVGKMGDVAGFKSLENPLSAGPWRVDRVGERMGLRSRSLERRGEEKLPEWWPKKGVEVAVGELEEGDDNMEFFQREANRLVRGK